MLKALKWLLIEKWISQLCLEQWTWPKIDIYIIQPCLIRNFIEICSDFEKFNWIPKSHLFLVSYPNPYLCLHWGMWDLTCLAIPISLIKAARPYPIPQSPFRTHHECHSMLFTCELPPFPLHSFLLHSFHARPSVRLAPFPLLAHLCFKQNVEQLDLYFVHVIVVGPSRLLIACGKLSTSFFVV